MLSKMLVKVAIIIIAHCFIHTERDTVVMSTHNGPPEMYDMYEYMVDGQPNICAEVDLTPAGAWKAYNQPNKLTKTFPTRVQAQEWVETMCKVMR